MDLSGSDGSEHRILSMCSWAFRALLLVMLPRGGNVRQLHANPHAIEDCSSSGPLALFA